MSADARLLATAERLLAGGPLAEEELARGLYGVAGPVGPWLRLLDSLLGGSEGFGRLPDGRWALLRGEVSAPQQPLLMAGRSTRARGGRLRELALTGADAPRPVFRWRFDTRPITPETLMQPDPLDGEEAYVRFEDVAEEVVELIQGRELLTLDDALFSVLSHELQLCGMPPLGNTVRILGRDLWLQGGSKRSLEAVRASLGLVSAMSDTLLGEVEVLRGLHDSPSGARIAPGTARNRTRLRERLRAVASSMPEGPGVYVFRDAADSASYIGSASNLRRRVLSYFSEQIELTRGLRGLLSSAARLDHVLLGTHLEALLEEAELIHNLQPPYNVQRKVSARAAWWLRVGSEHPVNVVQVASAPREDGALYVGPLPTRATADAAAGALAGLWGLSRRGGSAQTCDESRARLEELKVLLADPERFCGEMRARLHAMAARMPTRKWSVLASHVERTERAALGGELAPGASESGNRVVARYDETGGWLYLLLVRDLGCVACARVSAFDESGLAEGLRSLLAVASEGGEQTPERIALTARWLHSHRDDEWVLALDDTPDALAWRLIEGVRRRLEERTSPKEALEESW